MIEQYFSMVKSQLDEILTEQSDNMKAMSDMWVEAIRADRLLYTFGSNHSNSIGFELYWRAGGMAPVLTIEDPSKGSAERVEGYATTFMEQYDIQSGDILLVISNSGINPVPVEVAQYGKKVGAKIIAMTNLSQSKQANTRHSSGKKLYECADLVLDTMGMHGDAVVELPGVDWKVGPTSAIVSMAMLDAVVAETANTLLSAGEVPPVLISSNVPEGDAHNARMCEKYWSRLARFPRKRSV